MTDRVMLHLKKIGYIKLQKSGSGMRSRYQGSTHKRRNLASRFEANQIFRGLATSQRCFPGSFIDIEEF